MSNAVATGVSDTEISITSKPIAGLRYLNKRTRVDLINYQAYIPHKIGDPGSSIEKTPPDDLTRVPPRENEDDLVNISAFNSIDPEYISPSSDAKFNYTPKIRLVEKFEDNDIHRNINVSKLEIIDKGIDFVKLKFIISELKFQYNIAKIWHEQVHNALDSVKLESQKFHINEAKELLERGIAINTCVSLPLLPKLTQSLEECSSYTTKVNDFLQSLDFNESPLEEGNKLLHNGSQLPFITDEYKVLKDLWESHIDKTHQINNYFYRGNYVRIAKIAQDDFKLNRSYIKKIFDNVKVMLWHDQIKKMLSKTPKYLDAVKFLSLDFNSDKDKRTPEIEELENRCLAAKEWLLNISKSSVSQLIVTGVKEIICEAAAKKSKHPRLDSDETVQYFNIFKSDATLSKPHLIDESNPFFSQETLIQHLGGVDAIVESAANSTLTPPKTCPEELEKLYTLHGQIKLLVWCSKFLEPLAIKYRKFNRRFKRAMEGSMSKMEVAILLQDAILLSEQLHLDEQVEQLQKLIAEATEFENQCKQVLDVKRLATIQFESERLLEPWASLDGYRKFDKMYISEIENFINNYKPIKGVDIAEVDKILQLFENQSLKNYPLIKEFTDAKSIYLQWMDRMKHVMEDKHLSNEDLNRTLHLLIDARKYGINFETDPLLLNLKCYILSKILNKLIIKGEGDMEKATHLLNDLKNEKVHMDKLRFYISEMQCLNDEKADSRLKMCRENGIESYLSQPNGM